MRKKKILVMSSALLVVLFCLLTLFVINMPRRNELVDKEFFPQGVASGDPQHDGVLIWTRYDSKEMEGSGMELIWEVSKDSLFTSIVKTGKLVAHPDNDYCVKAYVKQLQPGHQYYYRFKHKLRLSPIGRTQTLPVNAEKIRLAIVNCSKFEGGFFNVYDAVSKVQNLNAVIHLGDYIYEDAGGQKPYLPIIAKTGRKHYPARELVTLQDYRLRYRQYHSDSMLIKLHQRYPMINIWDDHEFANNSWQGGVNGKVGSKLGNWDAEHWRQRVENAMKAYDEWIPIKKRPGEPIYRSFSFGQLLNLEMLDTRICCRSRQAVSKLDLEMIASKSMLLGTEQFNWLENSILNSMTIWNLIGNQILVAKRYLGDSDSYISFDQWTGYPKDRKRLLDFIKTHPDKNILIATGNVHDAFHFELLDGPNEKEGPLLAHEFAPGSISSGNTSIKKSTNERLRDSTELSNNNPHLKWFDLTKHSFMVMEFSRQKALIEYYQVSTVNRTNYTLEKAYSYVLHSEKQNRKDE